MNVLAQEAAAELVETEAFFAPTPYTAIDHLFGEYAAKRETIERMVAELTDARMGVVHYFQRGNANEDRAMPDPAQLFKLAGAYDRKGCKRAHWRKLAQAFGKRVTANPITTALYRACGWRV